MKSINTTSKTFEIYDNLLSSLNVNILPEIGKIPYVELLYDLFNSFAWYKEQNPNCDPYTGTLSTHYYRNIYKSKIGKIGLGSYVKINGKKSWVYQIVIEELKAKSVIKTYTITSPEDTISRSKVKSYSSGNEAVASYCTIYTITPAFHYYFNEYNKIKNNSVDDFILMLQGFSFNEDIISFDTDFAAMINSQTDFKRISAKNTDGKNDYEIAALQIMENLQFPDIDNIINDLYKNAKKLGDYNKIQYFASVISKIKTGRLFASLSENTGRLYTNFTNISRELRKYAKLKVKDQNRHNVASNLVGIDLKSAQPYFLANLIDDKEFYEIVTKDDIYLWLIDKLENTTLPVRYCSTYDSNGNITGKKECSFFRNQLIVSKYAKTSIIDYRKGSPDARQGMKIQFCQFLFSAITAEGKETKRNNVVTYIFEQHLPNFYNKILKWKLMLKENKNKNYPATLAAMLQQKESEIFMPIWYKYRKISLSLHDSIYVANVDDNVDQIKNALQKRFAAFGYKNYELKYE